MKASEDAVSSALHVAGSCSHRADDMLTHQQSIKIHAKMTTPNQEFKEIVVFLNDTENPSKGSVNC